MTASTTDLHAYIEDLRATVPYVHPAGRATIDAWLGEMHDAADQGDAATVARLARYVTNKIDQEIEWHRLKELAWPPKVKFFFCFLSFKRFPQGGANPALGVTVASRSY
jgi:hypothetical protein